MTAVKLKGTAANRLDYRFSDLRYANRIAQGWDTHVELLKRVSA